MNDAHPSPRRILVYGVTGSGKSQTATRLAGLHHLPLVLADDVAWQPGWRQVEPTVSQRPRPGLRRPQDLERWLDKGV